MDTRAESLARALGGRKSGAGWMARCPAHEDGTPSLSIGDADGRVLVYCHAGCSQERVLAVLRERRVWSGQAVFRRPPPLRVEHKPSDAAAALWRASHQARRTLVETYLGSRGLGLPATGALRFHHSLRHPGGERWPAMVALVREGAIHRTYLARDGSGKAPVEPSRMMLGPCRGGAVRLAPAGATLMVGEGIETCLAAMQATGLPAWAALSSSFLRALDLPDVVRAVIVLADGDDPGEAAARHAAQRWRDEGRRVRIARPPRGMDFNDMLLKRINA